MVGRGLPFSKQKKRRGFGLSEDRLHDYVARKSSFVHVLIDTWANKDAASLGVQNNDLYLIVDITERF
ncbi:hypothetical protein STEG23_002702, partial [Scotinomys teguina]